MAQDKEPVAAEEAQSTLLPPAPLKPRAAVIELAELPKTMAGPDPSASLIRSVKGLGVLQPVLLAYDGKRYKVLAGRRRIAAAREAELDNAVEVEAAGAERGLQASLRQLRGPELRPDGLRGHGAAPGGGRGLLRSLRGGVRLRGPEE